MYPQVAYVRGIAQKLSADSAKAGQYIDNALKRMIKCSPPENLVELAWTRTGKLDQNGLDIWKPNFHSCGVESMNARQMHFVVGANSTTETATALFTEGDGDIITKKEVPALLH